jgi:type II secretory pathway component PulL
MQWHSNRQVACMAALLLPLRQIHIQEKKNSKHVLTATAYIVQRSLKLPKREVSQLQMVHTALPELCRIHDQVSGMQLPSAFLSQC